MLRTLIFCALPALVFCADEPIRYNADARPQLRDAWEGFVQAGYLYWWTDVDGIAVATREEKVVNPEVKPDSGFKLGVGAYLPHDGWDFALKLTHLHSRAPVRAEGQLTPLWGVPQGSGFADHVRGHWRLHFALIDFELGRNFYVSRALMMRPHIGLRYGIIRQKYLIHYTGGTLFPDAEDYVSMKNKYLAPGVRTGVDLGWEIIGGFGLYSNFAASLLYGQVYVHESEKVSNEEEKRMNIFDKFVMAKPILDLGVGFRYETSLFQERYDLLLQAGWESHLLFAQNQLFHFLGDHATGFANEHGDLSVQGLTFSLLLSY
jgi:hypothetical protein